MVHKEKPNTGKYKNIERKEVTRLAGNENLSLKQYKTLP